MLKRSAYGFRAVAAMQMRSPMIGRFGEIVYFGVCAGAALVVILVIAGILLNIANENGAAIVKTLTIAAIAWGIGRTALHFLSRR